AHLASGGNVLPAHAAVVFDEAHELEDIVVSSFSVSLTAARIRNIAGLARTGGASAKVLERLRLLVPNFEDCVTGQVGETVDLGEQEGLAEVLRSVRGVCESAVSSLTSAEPAGQQARTANQQAVAALRSLATDMDTALGRAGDDGTATWVDGTEDRPRFCAASIDVAPVLAAELLPRTTVVATSATLTVGGTFSNLSRRLGFDLDLGAGPAQYDTLRVDTPFDYAKQGILYVADHLPDPTKERVEFEVAARQEVEALAVAAGGRTLALFTSWAAARAAAEHLRGATDLHVLLQGEAPRSDLVEEFARTPRSVLVATSSFWTGLDLSGDMCTLVVIDRIPFGRPNDPVVVARERICAERGGNGFMDVSLPAAAVSLAQGVGRLIRTTSDRGVVAVLDRRLVTARYGPVLLDTLPPLWRTNDRAKVEGSLRRLDAAALAAAD
ncbi:MAG: ATP-dependent DNA helicase, partial [Actinomycetes bacterium]